MGTRNLTCVVKDGEFKVAQYGQWDGYPDGAGSHILNFLASPGNIESLRARCDQISFLPKGELSRKLEAEGMLGGIKIGTEQERRYQDLFFWYDRDLGYKVLDALILSGGEVQLENYSSFALDSLFCEWAYVIDLDKNTFEVYQGFNKDFDADRGAFADVQDDAGEEGRNKEYAAVSLVKTYSLEDLPDKETLVEECDPPEEEEDE